MSTGRNFKKILEKMGGSEKAKPHSTKEGRVASGARKIRRILKKQKPDDYRPLQEPKRLRDQRQMKKPVQSRSRHQSVAEDKRLSATEKYERDVLGKDMSDKYKEKKATGGRAAFKHGKFVKVATPHADISKYVEKDSSKSPKHYRKEGSTLKMGKKRGGRRMGQATRDPGKKFKVKIPTIELVKEGPRNEKFGLRIRKSLGGAATHGFNTKILRS